MEEALSDLSGIWFDDIVLGLVPQNVTAFSSMITGCSIPRSTGGTTGPASSTSSLTTASSLPALLCSFEILATTMLGESHTTTLLVDLRLTG